MSKKKDLSPVIKGEKDEIVPKTVKDAVVVTIHVKGNPSKKDILRAIKKTKKHFKK